jgi:hypothetical protein
MCYSGGVTNTQPLDHKSQCEAEHGTAHLPNDVRSAIYNAAWEQGHAYGESEVRNIYPDFAEPALLAFKAGRSRLLSELSVMLGYCSNNKMVADRVVTMVQEWRSE